MKNILFLTYKLINGGAEKVILDIVNNIDKKKYNVTLMTIVDCSRDKNLLAEGVTYRYIFKDLIKLDRLFFKLTKYASPRLLHELFIKDNYDIEVAGLEGIPTKIVSGGSDSTKKIAIIHADPLNVAWPSGRYSNLVTEIESYNKLNNIIFVSEKTKENFFKKFNPQKPRFAVINNPVDRIKIIELSSLNVDDLTFDGYFVYISVGRLEKVKSFDRLLDAFKLIYRNHQKSKLIIIGEGRERKNLELHINNLGLSEAVHLLGYSNNPYKYINKSDCYVCSSLSEGLSTTIIEAMALNIPIVTTDCGGMKEILLNGECGVIVDNSTEGLIEGMSSVISGKINCEEMIKCQQKRIDSFTFKNYFDKFEEFLNI